MMMPIMSSSAAVALTRQQTPIMRSSLSPSLWMPWTRAGYSVFLDDFSLRPSSAGAWTKLQHAIVHSSITILVLSESYANSRWCLDEMALALERGQIVLPIWLCADPIWSLQKGADRAEQASNADQQRWKEAIKCLEATTAIQQDAKWVPFSREG